MSCIIECGYGKNVTFPKHVIDQSQHTDPAFEMVYNRSPLIITAISPAINCYPLHLFTFRIDVFQSSGRPQLKVKLSRKHKDKASLFFPRSSFQSRTPACSCLKEKAEERRPIHVSHRRLKAGHRPVSYHEITSHLFL